MKNPALRLYQILGIDPGATGAEVRRAYREKAKSSHPDVGGDVAEFQEISRAYAVLSNPVKRIVYDATGKEESAPAADEVAVSILSNLAEAAISAQQDPATFDFVKEMQRQVSDAISASKQQVRDIQRRVQRSKSLAKRITAKSGRNLLARIIEQRIAEKEREIASIEQQQANLEAALKLLEVYEYQVDAPQQAMSPASTVPLRTVSQYQNGFL